METVAEDISFRKLHPMIGMEITGIDVRTASRADLDKIVGAVCTHGVAVLPQQSLSEDDLGRLLKRLDPNAGYDTRHVGGLGTGAYFQSFRSRADGVFHLTNLDDKGEVFDPECLAMQKRRANELWHTDSTYMKPRATLSFLYARQIPPAGGETEYCDMRTSFEELDAREQARLRPLMAHHSLKHSRTLVGVTEWSDEELASLRSIPRPLVHRHAPTGRTALCLASHIEAIDGLSAEDSATLVADLTRHATAPDRVYRHNWRVDDLVIWDNRCTMHRGRPYDYTLVRDMLTARLWDAEDV